MLKKENLTLTNSQDCPNHNMNTISNYTLPEVIKSVVLAFRPKTLTAALVPCLAGTSYAAFYQSWSLKIFLYAMFSAIFIQIGTNLVNDAMDFKKGADTEKRIGPQRITQAGILTFNQVMFIATFFFVLAIILGVPLVLVGGWPIVVVGLISVLLGYGYTAGPFPLAYRGLGDLFVIIFFGLVAVQGIFYLHTQKLDWGSFVLGLQIGLLSTVLIAINNLRDIEGDAKVNKRTLAVRLGVDLAKKEITFLCLFPFVLNLFWIFLGNNSLSLITFLVFPLAIKIIKNIHKQEPSPIYNQFLGQAAGLHLIFGALISLSFAL